ncbi:hypothetical protein [Pseudomonas capeferrum]|nr:hypothetical protein [Pseudomonas capeferrum]
MNLWMTRLAVLAAGSLLLAVVWWGWQQGGLALMQLGMGAC